MQSPILDATPTLAKLLTELRGRLRRLVVVRALGLSFGVLVLWWAWAFFADYVLEVPRAVRAVHGALLIVLPIAVFWRTGMRHLMRLPDTRELAVLLEARRPTSDLFTSAVCFQEDPAQAGEAPPAMVARVLADAELRARELEHERTDPGVLDGRDARRVSAAAGLLLVAFGLASWNWTDHQGVFASRLFGAGQPWPQLTFLAIEIPLDTGVERDGTTTRVRLARGEDLPVTVVAEGRTPSSVELVFDDGSRRALAPSGEREGEALFTTTLRSLARDLAFTVEGGDDDRRRERVEVAALVPPDLTGLTVTVTPPTYSGLPARTEANSDVAVLEGSRLRFVAAVEPADATGVVRLLPEDRVVMLTPTPEGLAFELTAERSLRLRYELVDGEGLANPDPGLWSVTVDTDDAPRLAVRSPESLSLETTTAGIVPLWVAVEDDFAVTAAELIVTTRNQEGERSLELPLQDGPGEEPAPGQRHVFAPLSLDSLLAEGATPEAGQTHYLEVLARDNRAPAANVGNSPRIAVRVLSNEDYMRRVQDRLTGTRRRVSDLYDLARERLARSEELLDALVIDGLDRTAAADLDPATRGDLEALSSGTRRIEADALSIARELAALTGDALHARIDPEATGQVAELNRLIAERGSAEFDADLWSALFSAHDAGRLGSAGFAGNLITLGRTSLEIATEAAPASRTAVEDATRSGEVLSALELAIERQRETLADIEGLLGRLAEWDNFQSVLSLTREVLERQRALKERTKELATQ